MTFPFGPGAQDFLPGGGAELGVEYTLPSIPMLSLGADVLYAFTPIADGLGTTSQLAGLVSGAWRLPIVGRLSARFFARGGYDLGIVHGDPSAPVDGGLLVEGGTGLSFVVSPAAVVRLDASYLYLLGANGTVKVAIGLEMRPWPGSTQGAAVAAATPPAGLAAAAPPASASAPAVRRLLVVLEPRPAGSYSEVRRASLADSLALSLRRAAPGVLVIPYGNSDFPGPTDRRVEAAKQLGADCYVVVELSGDGKSAMITAESYDMLAETTAITPATVASTSTSGRSDPDWSPVVSLVARAYGKDAGTTAQ